MDTNITSYHDKFFKELFSKKEQASEFVLKTFPPEIVRNLKLETLELDKTEYISKKLRTNFSDVVYNCNYGKRTKIKITLLFEHKSSPESYPHLQLLGYILRIWELQIKQKQKLTPVIPIIFYHGIKKWHKKSFADYFENPDEILKTFIPHFDYQLIDTSNYTDVQIKELYENLQLQTGILLLKNIFNEQKILEEANIIFSGINQLLQTREGEDFFETIVAYLLYATKIDTEKYIETMKTISPKTTDKFISTAMKLRMEGMEKGMEKGIKEGMEKVALNMLKEGFENSLISKVTGLSITEIDKLRKKIKN